MTAPRPGRDYPPPSGHWLWVAVLLILVVFVIVCGDETFPANGPR